MHPKTKLLHFLFTGHQFVLQEILDAEKKLSHLVIQYALSGVVLLLTKRDDSKGKVKQE
jgi:hypothetical protein